MKNRIILLLALVLLPAALFAATITGTVSTGGTGGPGGAGTPVAGAKVVLLAATGGGGGINGRRIDSTTTNAQGQYTFTTDSTGARLIQVTATGYANGTGFVNVASATGSYTSNITLVANTGGGGSGNIAGTVTSGTGTAAAPVANATVILRRGGGGNTTDTVKTDAQGKYAFDSIPANTNYSLTVSATGFTTETRTGVAVIANQTATQNFTMTAPVGPGSIGGKVTSAANGSAVAGARVILTRSGGGGGGSRPDTVLTDAQGMFAFDSVANQGNYVLSVSAAGFSAAVNNNVDVSGGLKTTANFALLAVVAGDTTGTVKGAVTNAATHAPVANVRVILTRISGGGGNGTPVDTLVTDATGLFSFGKLAAPGNYRVSVSGTGFQNAQSNTLALAQGGTSIADFEMAAAASLLPPGVLARSARSHWAGARLVIELDASSPIRAIEAYAPDGRMLHRVPVAPGATRIVLPADIKPGMGALLRMKD
ncbi:MAG: hypothetical protein JWO30_1509 [Fibrobacteres bacterium]|nr:hypothetical protein [Fibrobacterota bacterium]